MDQQQIRTLAEDFISRLHGIEAGNQGSMEAMAELYEPQATLSNTVMDEHPDRSRLTGPEGALQFWQEYRSSFQTIQSEFSDITFGERSAGLFWQARGTDKNGSPIDYEGVTRLVFSDAGKITEFKGYFDSRQLTRKG